MRVADAELYTIAIPFRFAFAHAAASRDASDGLILKLTLEDGTVGYGECLARPYVTGESVASVSAWVATDALPFLAGLDIPAPDRLACFLAGSERGVVDAGGAAGCLLELALVDAYGKAFRMRVPDIFERPERDAATYAGVVGRMNGIARRLLLGRIRDGGLRHVKVKVGFKDDDVAAVRDCRRILGADAIIGLDANGAWSASDALPSIERLCPFSIDFVEQPTARDDAGLAMLTKQSPVDVVLDESVCTLGDAEWAAASGAGHGFSVRVSKVGGLRNALRLHDFALARGLRYHVGALVGETGILAAAGRHLALMTEPRITEGSFGDLLLSQDITEPSIRFGRNGRATALAAYGLGAEVVPDRLVRYAASTTRYALQGEW